AGVGSAREGRCAGWRGGDTRPALSRPCSSAPDGSHGTRPGGDPGHREGRRAAGRRRSARWRPRDRRGRLVDHAGDEMTVGGAVDGPEERRESLDDEGEGAGPTEVILDRSGEVLEPDRLAS